MSADRVRSFIDINYEPLTREQEAEAFLSGDHDAMIRGVLKILFKITCKYLKSGTHELLEDAFSAAMVGAFKSIEKFDPQKGRFSTWIPLPARTAIRNMLLAERNKFATTTIKKEDRPKVSCNTESLTDLEALRDASKLEQEESVSILLDAVEPFGLRDMIIRRAEGQTYREAAVDEGKSFKYLQTKVSQMRYAIADKIRSRPEFEGSPYLKRLETFGKNPKQVREKAGDMVPVYEAG